LSIVPCSKEDKMSENMRSRHPVSGGKQLLCWVRYEVLTPVTGPEEEEVTLRLTVIQSVCLGIEHPRATYFLSECRCLKFAVLYGAPSLTRGRVCNFKCNHSMVLVRVSMISYI
jgi:hypothetical protein